MKLFNLGLIVTVAVGLTACSDNPTSVMDESDAEFSAAVNTRSANVESGPSVTTDKGDYAPGETVTITGSGWLPGETVRMLISENPEICDPDTLTSFADADGNFMNTDFAPEEHDIGVEFTLVATGQTSGWTAQTVFTDGNPTVNSFTLNGSSSAITVALGSTIAVSVNATTHYQNASHPATWKSTAIQFRNLTLSPPVDYGDEDYCDDTNVVDPSLETTTSHSFNYVSSPLVAATYDVRVKVFEGDGCTGGGGTGDLAGGLTLTSVSNAPPTVDANGPYSGNEGSNISIAGTATDSDPLTYLWTYSIVTADAGASCSFGDATALSTTVSCTDDGSYTLTLTVDDGVNAPVSDVASLTVYNVAPSITITSPADGALYPISQMVSVTAPFTDPGSNDTHTCTFNWDDGMTTGPTASTSPCSSSHSYATFGAGIFGIIVTATDDDGGADSDTVFVIVYDPSGGFVTGGGWIMSPAGAYKPDESLAGRANFGFVSKYKKGASVPTGNTEFQFQAGNLNFHSEDFEWLVVNKAGTNAQYKGTGTINGTGTYKFMLWAGDGSPDTFRIRIWEENGGEIVVYDNGVAQAIGGGSIVIHVK